jgi:C-terminal processing protease CtpA/Prc
VVSVAGEWVAPPLIDGLYTERFIGLTDLTAFVRRDSSLLLSDDQIAARLVPSGPGRESFRLSLPIVPRGLGHRLGEGSADVQIFAVSVQRNLVGDPFMSGYEMAGWAAQLPSVTTTPGNEELSGGRIVVWTAAGAPFPSGFGADGRLFTADDPLQELDAGWTVIDLDAAPFAALRDETVDVPVHNGDMGRDLSSLSYTAAFDRLIDELRGRYPFTDVKQLDWAALTAEVRPLVQLAERDADAVQLGEALWRLGMLMGDGHVAPIPAPVRAWTDRFGAGVGLRLAQTDDGDVLVTAVTEGSPAATAGIEVGALLTRYDDLPIADALAARGAADLATPQSSPHGVRSQQLALLSRSSEGTNVSIELVNPSASEPARAQLTSVSDLDGLVAILTHDADPTALPVTTSVLPSGIGYIRVTTFSEDMTLTSHAWERGLRMLQELDVPSLIVDVRGNSGGVDAMGMYFAGSFYADSFVRSHQLALAPNGELVHRADNMIRPAPVQWDSPVAVLIDEHCMSTCEEFSAAMSHDPQHLIVGASNSGGVEAEVYFWILPGDVLFTSPVAMFNFPNGELFVEGSGVAPNVRVEKTRAALLSGADYVLDAAVQQLSLPAR